MNVTFRENVSGKGHPREVAFSLAAPVLRDEVPVLPSLELPIPTGCLVSTNPASRKDPPRLSAHGPHRPSGRRDVLPGGTPGRADPGHSHPEVMARGCLFGGGKEGRRPGRPKPAVRSRVLRAQSPASVRRTVVSDAEGVGREMRVSRKGRSGCRVEGGAGGGERREACAGQWPGQGRGSKGSGGRCSGCGRVDQVGADAQLSRKGQAGRGGCAGYEHAECDGRGQWVGGPRQSMCRVVGGWGGKETEQTPELRSLKPCVQTRFPGAVCSRSRARTSDSSTRASGGKGGRAPRVPGTGHLEGAGAPGPPLSTPRGSTCSSPFSDTRKMTRPGRCGVQTCTAQIPKASQPLASLFPRRPAPAGSAPAGPPCGRAPGRQGVGTLPLGLPPVLVLLLLPVFLGRSRPFCPHLTPT